MVANLEVLKELAEVTPEDFRFPILMKLGQLANRHLPKLKIQLAIHAPMSMKKVKILNSDKKLDTSPLLTTLFYSCCDELLKVLHNSSFCVPKNPAEMDSDFLIGLGTTSFEDKTSQNFKNQNFELCNKLLQIEPKAAQKLVEAHREQDRLMTQAWETLDTEDLRMFHAFPTIPKPTTVYNLREPYVIANEAEQYRWFDEPAERFKSKLEKLHLSFVEKKRANRSWMPPISVLDDIVAGDEVCPHECGNHNLSGISALLQAKNAMRLEDTMTEDEQPMDDRNGENENGVFANWNSLNDTVVTSTPRSTKLTKRSVSKSATKVSFFNNWRLATSRGKILKFNLASPKPS